MSKIKEKLDFVVTLGLILCVGLCGILVFQQLTGRQPSLFGYRMYHVITGSMEPTIETGGNVIVKSVDEDELSVGDIITFQSKEAAIYGHANTHRILRIEMDEQNRRVYVTKGDANPVEDEEIVYYDEIYGKVVYSTNAIKWFSLFFDFVRTKEGFFTVIVFPLMFATYLYVKDFINQVNQMIRTNVEQEIKEEMSNEENTD